MTFIRCGVDFVVCGYYMYFAVPSVFQRWSESIAQINVLAGSSMLLLRRSS